MLCVDKRAAALRRELSKQALKQGRTYRRDEKWAGRAGPPDAEEPEEPEEPACVRVPELAGACACVAREPAEDGAAEWDVVGPDDIDGTGDRARPCIARCTVS